jgi:CRISPR/Cas system-associated protein Csm6
MASLPYTAIMIRTQIQFEQKTYEALKTKSNETGKSISEIVRRSLDRSIAAQEVDQKWARALSSMGKFSSGLNNLAEKHDDHLGDRW